MHKFTVILLLCTFINCKADEQFTEHLQLKTVNNNYQLYSFFNFSTSLQNTRKFHKGHYNLFPRSVGELIKRYHVAEFHLSMTQGLWKPEVWDYAKYSSPPGAQLWVWFDSDVDSVDESWSGFTNVLSGLLCASLDFIKQTDTVSPKYSFRPDGAVTDVSSKYLRHAVLPRENLCTENLTPWLKLLPCGSHSGLASLLHPARLQQTRFLSLGLHFWQSCDTSDSCVDPTLHLAQDISTVNDLRLSTGIKPDFSTAEIFERVLKGFCPVSSQTDVTIIAPGGDVKMTPEATYKQGNTHVFDIQKLPKVRNIKVGWNAVPQYVLPTSPPIIFHCFLTGYEHTERGIQCSLTNNAWTNATVIYTQTVPWFLHVYLHTLKIVSQDKSSIKPDTLYFEPSHIRQSPSFLELILTIPQQSTVEVSISFTRGFLTWLEYPPDAHHGFYIGAPMITIDRTHLDSYGVKSFNDACQLYAEPMVVIIPTPDFSMPYNVICLACTVVAIAFGSFHNLTTRRFQLVSAQEKTGLQKFISKFKKGKDSKIETRKESNETSISDVDNAKLPPDET